MYVCLRSTVSKFHNMILRKWSVESCPIHKTYALNNTLHYDQLTKAADKSNKISRKTGTKCETIADVVLVNTPNTSESLHRPASDEPHLLWNRPRQGLVGDRLVTEQVSAGLYKIFLIQMTFWRDFFFSWKRHEQSVATYTVRYLDL